MCLGGCVRVLHKSVRNILGENTNIHQYVKKMKNNGSSNNKESRTRNNINREHSITLNTDTACWPCLENKTSLKLQIHTYKKTYIQLKMKK